MNDIQDVQGGSLPQPEEYALNGPQVEPEASYWIRCPKPCVISLDELRAVTDDPNSPMYFPPYPEDDAVVADELAELRELEALRDEHFAFQSTQQGRERLPLSLFLQIRPQTVGAAINTAREPNSLVIQTPRELARYFEEETPGLAHRHALDYLLRNANFSPPRQAWIWAALDVTIYSALLAAWHYKWLGTQADGTFRSRISRRPRPIEYVRERELPALNVLFDRAPNSTYSADNGDRPNPQPSPGTPRHPAYPSGHSTYGGAASELLSYFFPEYRLEFDRLADNTGLARLWAGIHWRSDHVEGIRLGRTVAQLVIRQLEATNICLIPNSYGMPPTRQTLEEQGQQFAANCGRVVQNVNPRGDGPVDLQAPGPQEGAR